LSDVKVSFLYFSVEMSHFVSRDCTSSFRLITVYLTNEQFFYTVAWVSGTASGL